VNDLPDPLLSEKILQESHQCEGKPAWYDIAASIGAVTASHHRLTYHPLAKHAPMQILRRAIGRGPSRCLDLRSQLPASEWAETASFDDYRTGRKNRAALPEVFGAPQRFSGQP
jgi:hypothetical protein